MRRALLTAVCGLLTIGPAAPAGAATKSVTISGVFGNATYSPNPVALAARGDTAKWVNEGNVGHTATGNSPFNLWNTGTIAVGSSKSFTFISAGTYPYHCAIHPSMTGTVRVPIALSKSGTTVTVTVASKTAPNGFHYVVQKTGPGDTAFKAWKTITATTTTFAGMAGKTYSFRSKMKRVNSTASSGFSVARSITV